MQKKHILKLKNTPDVLKVFGEKHTNLDEIVLEYGEFTDFVDAVKLAHSNNFDFITEVDSDIDEIRNHFTLSGDDTSDLRKIVEADDIKNIVEDINLLIQKQLDSDTAEFCGIDSNHGILFPGYDKETNEVVMGCKKCGYIKVV